MKMENLSASLLFSNSSENDSFLQEEFPYWKLGLAIDLLFYSTFSLVSIFILNLPLLVAVVKINKKKFKALNTLHMSFLTATIVEEILQLVTRFFYVPGVYRFCYCDKFIGTLLVLVASFFIVYRSYVFVCLAVLQFLVVFGKKNLAYSLKASVGMILFSIGISLVYDAAIADEFHKASERVICYDAYCPGHRPEEGIGGLIKVLISFTLSTYLPTIVVVIVTSTWSCVIFKKYYTGGDDQLNRKMLSLPFVMPLASMASSLLEIVSVQIVAEILLSSSLPLGVYLPYWIRFAQSLVFIPVRLLNRLIYPFVLVYTHAELRQSIDASLKRFKVRNNQVTPVQVN